MCGIAGYWNVDGKASEAPIVEKMLDTIVHRGPDDRGIWLHESIGLGHQRLSLLDLSPRGHQPFLTADGAGALTYNGEVYNYLELRKELEQEGIVFRSTTDTEVVLYALHRWGADKAIPRFDGMFGLAYLDLRSNSLVLARDRLGIKPLYVSQNDTCFVFGSEIKALLAHPTVESRPNRQALVMHALFQRIDNQSTPFEVVESLEPGSYWTVSGKTIERVKYFDALRDLELERLAQANARQSDQFIHEFEELFSKSVRIHLASDAPLATMCSGGVDSSLVTSSVSDTRNDVVAYVADVKGAISEGPKARRVAKYLGVEIRQVDVDEELALRLWPQATWLGDQPNTHGSDMPMLAVAQACRRDGVKAILTGEGSDELFGGYDWQAEVFSMWRRWHRHPFSRLDFDNRWHRGLASLVPKRFYAEKPNGLFPRTFWRNDENLQQFKIVFALDPPKHLRATKIFEKLDGVGPIEERAFLARCIDDLYGHLESLLKRNDRMAMGASVETRVPFIENKLIDLGLHTPFHAKYKNREGKWLVKEAARKSLPEDIVFAKKIGFSASWDYFKYGLPFLKNGMVSELFCWGRDWTMQLLPLLKKDPVLVWNIVSIELWARLYLRGESADELGEKLVFNYRNKVDS